MEKSKYYVVRDKALPEVLQKVAEAKQLLDKNRSMTVQEATERLGLSRSSFYKYKDDIAPFSDNTRGKTVTLVIQMEDEPGLLSDLLHVVSDYRANILTIHQTIPVNGIATVTLSVEVRDNTAIVRAGGGDRKYDGNSEHQDTGSRKIDESSDHGIRDRRSRRL